MSQVAEVEILPGLHFVECVKCRQKCAFWNALELEKKKWNQLFVAVQAQKSILCDWIYKKYIIAKAQYKKERKHSQKLFK